MSKEGQAAWKRPSIEDDQNGSPHKRGRRELQNLSFTSPGVKTAIAGPIRETIARQTRRCTYKVVLDEENIEHEDAFTEIEGLREDRALHLAAQLEASLTGFVDDVYGEEGDIPNLIRTRDAQCPLGHMGDAWDTAYATLFLASDEAKYITATELLVDGGLSARFA